MKIIKVLRVFVVHSVSNERRKFFLVGKLIDR